MTNNSPLEIIKAIQEKNNPKIVITTHHKPDADAMGSSLGLYHFLKQIGIEAQVISPTDFANNLNWMPSSELVLNYEIDTQKCIELAENADFIFCLDFNGLKRINEFGEDVKRSNAKKILIDHHQNPEGFQDFTFWDVNASSTCELVYRLISESLLTKQMNANIASCLYAGIMTDTGSFKFGNCTSSTHKIVAELLDYGANNVEITDLIYDSYSEERIRFIGYAISQKLQVLRAYNTALIVINQKEINDFNLKTGDTEGLVNYGLSIEGIRFAALIIDRTKLVKMSFRSKGQFSVNNFSRLYFNGGGHFNASGGSSEDTLDNTVNRFLEVLKNHQEELNA